MQLYSHASKIIEDNEKKIKDLENDYEKLCSFYGENPKELTFELFFEIFNKFFNEIIVKTL